MGVREEFHLFSIVKLGDQHSRPGTDTANHRLALQRLVLIIDHRHDLVRVEPHVHVVLHEGLESVHAERPDRLHELIAE